LDLKKRGIVLETKLSPRAKIGLPEGVATSHSPEHLRLGLDASLKALKTDKVDMWYMHAPDRSTPYDVTFKAINDLYKEGKFNRLGISNYAAWEVAEIVELCDRYGWIKPTVYQGVYNGLHRLVEPELFPCLRKYGIAFYAFNPLAGGFLTDRYTRDVQNHEQGSRFDPHRTQGANYRRRYWSEEYFDALDILRAAAKKHELTEAECALRWISHHSLLSKEHGDGIIIGASSAKQLEQNLIDFEKEKLPDDIIQAFDQGWAKVKGVARQYFH
jgi:aflatoxin B1 aldehyde reductase